MLRFWTRFIGALRVAYRVFCLEWDGQWSQAVNTLSAWSKKEDARHASAKETIDALRERPFLATLFERIDLRAVQGELDELVEEAHSFDGALRVMASLDAELAPEIDAAKPADFLLAWNSAYWAFILATVIHRAADQPVGAIVEALEQQQRDRARADRVH